MSEKIEPALSATAWAHWLKEPEKLRLDVACAADAIAYSLGQNTAALIAICNAALPDSDPRKITREKIATIRLGLDRLPRADDEDASDYQAAKDFADALDSYLPPETPR